MGRCSEASGESDRPGFTSRIVSVADGVSTIAILEMVSTGRATISAHLPPLPNFSLFYDRRVGIFLVYVTNPRNGLALETGRGIVVISPLDTDGSDRYIGGTGAHISS
jgi:hypothetical protein